MKKLVKTRNFFKSHLTSLILFVILLMMVLVVIVVVSVLVPTTRISQYGNRLEGISEVKLSSDYITTKTNELKTNASISSLKIRLTGKTINIEVKLADKVTVAVGKDIANAAISKFSEKEIAYYDFQVFLTTYGEGSTTVIGYKTPNVKILSWTNN